MSEFNPFNAAAEEAPAAPEVAEEEGRSRKAVLLVGGLAALILGAGAYLFLGGSSDDVEEFAPVAQAPRAAAPAASASPAAKLPVSTKVSLGRNPFRALYVQPAAAAASTGTTSTATTAPAAPAGTGTTTPVVIVDSGSKPSTGTSGGSTTPQQPAPAPATQSTVALKGVTAGKDGANPTGTFVYDGQKVTGAPGDVMAGKLLVISLQQDATGGWFANLQLGDGAPFEVHERQTVVVQ